MKYQNAKSVAENRDKVVLKGHSTVYTGSKL